MQETRKLVILDDAFPNMLSGFRIAEYNYYLKCVENSRVLSTAPIFDQYKYEYNSYYSNNSERISKLTEKTSFNDVLLYMVFLNNAYNYLKIIEAHQSPFVFTLYPGGGFWINSGESDNKLKKVLNSDQFRGVIVTQKNSYEYLIKKKYCSKDKIHFIYGGILPSDFYKDNPFKKLYFNQNKSTFDICFVANRYIDKGIDKGYDTFIEVAKSLNKQFSNVKFHVVGDWSHDSIDTSELGDHITFYGPKHSKFFLKFYASMDIILSPNKPDVLNKGAFDGFPTGSCIEAGLAGVAVFCTDKLQLNRSFVSGDDILIIDTEVENIVNIIGFYYSNPDELYVLSQNCQMSFCREFDLDKQMTARLAVLNKHLS